MVLIVDQLYHLAYLCFVKVPAPGSLDIYGFQTQQSCNIRAVVFFGFFFSSFLFCVKYMLVGGVDTPKDVP